VLVSLFSGCVGEEEPSGEISMTDIDRTASEITENVNLNDPTVSISTKLLADDPSKEIELESVDVTTIQYVYNFSITVDRTMDDTLVVVGKDASGEIVYNRTEPIHLESGETQFFEVYIPVHKRDGQIIEDLTLTFKTLDEEIREVKTGINTEKKPYAVSDKLKKRFASFDSNKDGKLSEGERQDWWDWVEEHVNRVPDEFSDYTKTPDETVNEGGGDCEDMAVLNAEFYKSHDYEVQILYVATDKVGAYKGKRDHALTRVKIADEWMVVDNAAGSRLGDTIETPAIPHPVDFSLEHYLRIRPIKGEKIDPDAIDIVGYDFNYDGKPDLVSFDLNKDGVVDTYEFYKDGKKIQERHFEDEELINTDYYDEDGNLISGETPKSEEVSPKGVGSTSAYQLECERIHNKLAELNAKRNNIYESFPEFREGGTEEGIACWTSRMEGHKQIKEIYEEAHYNEQMIIPPIGTENLHNNFLNYSQCIVDCAEYQIEESKFMVEAWTTDSVAASAAAHRYYDKAIAKSNEAYEYYENLQMEIYNNTGLERPYSITVFHD
jgi:hypothetical protein